MIEVSLSPSKAGHLGGEPPLLLCGFTVRALAEAATEANYRVYAIDHFGDQDLREIACGLRVVDSWKPNGTLLPPPSHPSSHLATGDKTGHILELLEQLRDQAMQECGSQRPKLLLAGGTETWPELIDDLQDRFETLGPTSTQIRRLRDLDFCRRAAEAAGICFPSVTWQLPSAAGSTGQNGAEPSWLRKQAYSSGGTQVKRVAPSRNPSPDSSGALGQPSQRSTLDRPAARASTQADDSGPHIYFQSEVCGRVLGATCLLFREESTPGRRNRGRLLSVAESWKQEDWPGPAEFLYRGSWGPIQVSEELRQAIERLADFVARDLGLLGWLQIDFIQDPSGRLWLLEFNPRWAASMETLTLCGCNPLPWHIWAFQDSQPENQPAHRWPDVTSSGSTASKAILYADRDLLLQPHKLRDLHGFSRCGLADLPSLPKDEQGNPTALHIKAGQPLLTLRNCDSTKPSPDSEQDRRRCQLRTLQARAAQVWEALG